MLKITLLLVVYLVKINSIDNSECISPPFICPNENITFWLYTRDTQQNPHELNYNDPESISGAYFVPNAPIKFLIHGYTGNKDFDPNIDTRPAYFQRGEYNIISIDYGPIVKNPCYLNSVSNVPLVSRCAAQIIDELVNTDKISLKDLHVVGMSLGAHVAGGISTWLRSGQIERITGLDPALPFFATYDTSRKLDKTDAKFVDVIHTNALGLGKLENLGHVDFYVNGGKRQKGCEKDKKMSVNGCSHWRSALYFAESINSKRGFYGRNCSSWFFYNFGFCENNADYYYEAIMGEDASMSSEGLFFVDTNEEPPFALGKSMVNKYYSPNNILSYFPSNFGDNGIAITLELKYSNNNDLVK